MYVGKSVVEGNAKPSLFMTLFSLCIFIKAHCHPDALAPDLHRSSI